MVDKVISQWSMYQLEDIPEDLYIVIEEDERRKSKLEQIIIFFLCKGKMFLFLLVKL